MAKPAREALVAVARALDRNPSPLLILSGHLTEAEARDTLRPLFREGSELAEIWSGCSDLPLETVREIVHGADGDEIALRTIAVDVFRVQESDETLWDDSYALAAAKGEGADELREVMALWRFLGSDLRTRWLDYGRQLRNIADLEYLVTAQKERLGADFEESSR